VTEKISLLEKFTEIPELPVNPQVPAPWLQKAIRFSPAGFASHFPVHPSFESSSQKAYGM